MTGTKLHNVWKGMMQRTTSKNSTDYKYYGGRGITVCKRWLEFVNFHSDMASSYNSGLTLERIDNSKGYSPDNCKWATRQEQNRNTRQTIVYRGETQADASRRLGLGHAGVGNPHGLIEVTYKKEFEGHSIALR